MVNPHVEGGAPIPEPVGTRFVKLLIVDDDRRQRELYEVILQGDPRVRLTMTATVEEAIQHLRTAHDANESFDGVISDLWIYVKEPVGLLVTKAAMECGVRNRYIFTAADRKQALSGYNDSDLKQHGVRAEDVLTKRDIYRQTLGVIEATFTAKYPPTPQA